VSERPETKPDLLEKTGTKLMITSTPNRATIGKALALAVLVAALVVSFMLAANPAHASTTFTVINTNDAGPGSLRQAILDANDMSGADIIEFDIPGTGVHTIAPTSRLPTVTRPVTINGYSQPGAQPNTRAVGSDAALKIMLSGAKTVGANALVIGTSNSTVRGLVINQWQGVGIRTDGPGATANRIAGNYIGTDKNGTAPLGNADQGVFIGNSPNNTIGGTSAGAHNVISASKFYGVGFIGDTAMGNCILSNSIFSNVELGIDLLASANRGRTDNDFGDIDTGPNGLQNFPLLSSAKKGAAGTTTVRGKLNSTPGKTFNIQFFSNPKGTNEGKTLLGSRTITTDGSGDVSFAFSTKKTVRLGQNITATATGPGGNTSEFSAPNQVVAS
jgi:hypothetical protein